MRRLLAAVTILAAVAPTATAAPSFKLRRVTALDAATQTVHVAAPRGDRRLFVVDQRGVVRVLSGGTLKTFIDLRSRVEPGGERGLLSIAFHPRFASNGRFFVYYTARGTGDITVAEGRATGDRGRFRKVWLRVRHREAGNHNGGQLAFGPDRRLWIGTGDGGGGGDQFGHAQDRRSRLGKMLRLDVDRPGATASIWGIGLRNPWRFSFDRRTGTLWIGDVGQSAWEEVDRVSRPHRRSLRNFGWSRYEGRAVYDASRRLTGGTLVRPLIAYSHAEGVSITGGFVYRGSDVPALRGYYLYADFGATWIRGFKLRTGARPLRFEKRSGVPGGITTFGEDGRGNVYVATHDAIYRIVK